MYAQRGTYPPWEVIGKDQALSLAKLIGRDFMSVNGSWLSATQQNFYGFIFHWSHYLYSSSPVDYC